MAMMICPTCNDVFCALCYTWQHRSGKRTSHRPTALDGTPLATDAAKKSLEGTTEHFVSQLERKSAPTQESTTSSAAKHNADADRPQAEPTARTPEDEARGELFASACEYIPLRLNDDERGLLKLLEAALKVSELSFARVCRWRCENSRFELAFARCSFFAIFVRSFVRLPLLLSTTTICHCAR